MVGAVVFVDLFESMITKDAEGFIKAYNRGAPEAQPKPANPDTFKGGIAAEEEDDEKQDEPEAAEKQVEL